ncbi:MAG: hypothetical protein K2M64_01360 [Clostridia bacterium]|nr:hypothetical protein [Clostridia bacterium]
MKKAAEKVALVAQICITLVFAVTTLLNITNVYNNGMEEIDYGYTYGYNLAEQNNSVLMSLIIVLFVVYLALSAYMLYVNFSERENLKRVLLFCDSESATRTTTKVVNKIIAECSRQTEGITVKKIRIRPDEKQGFAINLKVNVNADNVSQVIDTFRCLLADNFENTLGLKFNTINFEVAKLNTRYLPNVKKAEEQAEKLSDQREVASEIYNEPLDNQINLDCVIDDKTQQNSKQDK